MKTGSGSHDYKLLKRGVICKILYGNWVVVIQILTFRHYFLVMVDYVISESH